MAAGTAPLGYQWSKNGAAVSGATSASYTTPATVLADSGSTFTVAVSNSAGSVTSNAAMLTVQTSPTTPSITTQPVSQTVAAGSTATFAVVAAGTAPLGYQWSKNGAAISGATSASYTTPATVIADSGAAFTATVSNSAGSVTSSAATLTVTAATAPSITTQPTSQTVNEGSSATFTVVAAGTAPLGYQWKKNGTAVSGATSASYTTGTTVVADSGSSFTVTVSNTAGSATSDAATLTVNATAPTISTQPASQTVTAGSTATFTVVATGTAPLDYQWKKNGTIISGATSASYTTAATVLADNGSSFSVTVSNSAGSVTSDAVTLTVQTAPVITTQPSSQTVVVGNSVSFSAVALGNPTPTYQWKKGGVSIAGATSSTYTIASVSLSDAATYVATAANSVGSIDSSGAVLTVHAPPAITTQPASSQTVTAGNAASFTVVASGNPAPTYQWQKDGVAISGATSPTYTIAATILGDAATYMVVVTNSVSSVTSSGAVLSVQDKPGAPTSFLLTSLGFGFGTFSWNPPLSNGNSAITGYRFTATSPAGSVSTTNVTATGSNPAFKLKFTPLTDGANYTFTVAATNAVGTGPAASVTGQPPCVSVGLPGYSYNNKENNPPVAFSGTPLVILFTGDFNRDGHQDVLAVGHSVVFYPGHGDATFGYPQISPLSYSYGGDLAMIGDFNNDSIPDLVVDQAGTPVILFGDGNGGFQTPSSLTPIGALSAPPVAGAVGELIPGSGNQDIVIGGGAVAGGPYGGSTYTVLLGAGNGTFPQRADHVLAGGWTFDAMALVDLNKDGKLDLILGAEGGSGSALLVLIGNGDGTFQAPVVYPAANLFYVPTDPGPITFEIKTGDVNKDGIPDVVAVGYAGADVHGNAAPNTYVWLGLADGGLAPPTTIVANGSIGSVLLDDFNGDGNLDLAVGSWGRAHIQSPPNNIDNVQIFLGAGDGGFGSPLSVPVGAVVGHSLAAGDFNADGKRDLAIQVDPSNPGFFALLGEGDGGFVAPAQYQPPFPNALDLAVTAIDGDGGVPTILALGYSDDPSSHSYPFTQQVAAYRSKADGGLQAPVVSTLWTSDAVPNGMTVGELTDAGRPDLVVYEGSLVVAGSQPTAFDVFLNNAAGGFAPPATSRYTTGGVVSDVAICDVNHDGKPDIVAYAGGEIEIFPGKGDGTFGVAYPILQNQFTPSPLAHLACVDLNGDGNPDLLISSEGAARIVVVLGNGDFTFKPPLSYGTAAAQSRLEIADVNHDGKLDVVFLGATGGTVYALLGDGAGAFPTARSTVVNSLYKNPPLSLSLADIDGDGNLDVVVTSYFSSVGVFFGAGDGTFPLQVGYNSGGYQDNLNAIVTADFNGDGRIDVAALIGIQDSSGTALEVLLNKSLSACY